MHLRLLILLSLFLSSAWSKAATTTLPTIDLIGITTRSAGSPHTYTPGGAFLLLVEETESVHLSTGEVGMFGAGGSSGSTATFATTVVSGAQLQFSLNPISGGKFYERSSFSSPLPFVRTGFRLDLQGPLTLVAQTGSFTALLSGTLLVARNGLQAPFAGTDAALLGAGVGDRIPFSVTYTRQGTPWSATSFASPFSYTMNAQLVTAAVPEPGTAAGLMIGLAFGGLARRRRVRSAGAPLTGVGPYEATRR